MFKPLCFVLSRDFTLMAEMFKDKYDQGVNHSKFYQKNKTNIIFQCHTCTF
jgi:hypothetical protein